MQSLKIPFKFWSVSVIFSGFTFTTSKIKKTRKLKANPINNVMQKIDFGKNEIFMLSTRTLAGLSFDRISRTVKGKKFCFHEYKRSRNRNIFSVTLYVNMQTVGQYLSQKIGFSD